MSRRWRVTLRCLDPPVGDLNDPATPRGDYPTMERLAAEHPDLGLSFERSGHEVIVALNVTADDEDTARDLGEELLVQVVPARPETTGVRLEVRPLKAEPDFT
jgi:hypothetical protein